MGYPTRRRKKNHVVKKFWFRAAAAATFLVVIRGQSATLTLNDCDTTNGWMLATEGARVARASSQVQGSGALRFTLPGNTPRILYRPPAEKRGAIWSDYEGLRFHVRGDGSTAWGIVTLYESANWYRFYATFPISSGVWTEVTIPWREFVHQHYYGTIEEMRTQIEYVGFAKVSGYTPGHPPWPVWPEHRYDVDDIRLVNGLTLEPTPVPTGTSVDRVRGKLARKEPVKIVVVGSSVEWGLKLETDNPAGPFGELNGQRAYARKLEALLRSHYGYEQINVVNYGIRGADSFEGGANLGMLVWNEEPVDLLIVGAFYANDASDIYSEDLSVTNVPGGELYSAENHDRIFCAALRRGVDVMFVASTVHPAKPNGWDPLVNAIKAKAANRKIVVADAYGQFQPLGSNTLLQLYYTYYQDIHPNSTAHVEVAKIVRDTLVSASAPPSGGGQENWPGYEKDNRHHNASAVEVNPVGFRVRWEKRMGPPKDCYADHPGFFGSRNLALRDGLLAVVGVPDNGSYPGARAYVTILDATNGAVRNCLQTRQYHGPHRSQFSVEHITMEAYDSGIGITWVNWDPSTGILFMRNGGDGANNTGYLPLHNLATYGGPGTYQVAKGAWEDFYANYPLHQDQIGLTRDDKYTPTFGTPPAGPDYLLPDHWDHCGGSNVVYFPNQPGSFEVDVDGEYVVANNDSGHPQAGGVAIINKYTGARGRFLNGSIGGSELMIEPPNYVAPKPQFMRVFKMWGGSMVASNRIFFLCPGDVGDATATTPGDSDLGNDYSWSKPMPDQGLYIIARQLSWQNLKPDGGYAGPGAAETAVIGPVCFNYRVSSLTLPVTNWNMAESCMEYDSTYRNKAWLVDGTGVWVAWKPCRTANVELIHCDDDGMQRYDLGIGAGLRGQDIWPHISLAVIGGQKYIVYYAGNAWFRDLRDGFAHYYRKTTVSDPLGPASLAVFNATARRLVYTYELNNATRTGRHPTLPPNEAEGYFDRSQMVVAGSRAYIAWVDSSGTTSSNALLRLLSFYIPTAQPDDPREFIHNLQVPAGSNQQSAVFDLIAANGWLYALVTLSPILCSTNHTFTEQRIVALAGDPTGEPGGSTVTMTLNPIADTWVNGDYDHTANYGSDSFMHIYGMSHDTLHGGAISDMLIKFDLSSIPSDAVVSNATLRLYWLNTNPNRGTTVYVCGARRPWREGDGTAGSGATFLTRDGSTAWEGGNINASTNNYDPNFTAWRARFATQSWANTYVEFNVTSLVADWVGGRRPNYGFVVVNNGKVPNPDFQNMQNNPPSEYNVASRESANPPQLEVTFWQPPEPRGGMVLTVN